MCFYSLKIIRKRVCSFHNLKLRSSNCKRCNIYLSDTNILTVGGYMWKNQTHYHIINHLVFCNLCKFNFIFKHVYINIKFIILYKLCTCRICRTKTTLWQYCSTFTYGTKTTSVKPSFVGRFLILFNGEDTYLDKFKIYKIYF